MLLMLAILHDHLIFQNYGQTQLQKNFSNKVIEKRKWVLRSRIYVIDIHQTLQKDNLDFLVL